MSDSSNPGPETLPGSGISYDDIWLADGCRSGFGALNGSLSKVSATDLGIAVARKLFERGAFSPEGVDMTIAANLSPTDFDAIYLPRHIALYAGVPEPAPAIMVQRLCGSGFETLITAADYIKLGKATASLCVGTEVMSRNPIASFTARNGFKLGKVDFKDYLWEAFFDPAPGIPMGGTAENLARQYQITREDADGYAARSFEQASNAHKAGLFADEIVALETGRFEQDGLKPRHLKLPRKKTRFAEDEHVRPTDMETLRSLPPVFAKDGVQTAGNSSGIVDGAAAALVVSGDRLNGSDTKPLARIVAGAAVGVPAEIMGIGPAPAIRKLLDIAGLSLGDIGRIEINEAFAAQYIAVERELGLDRERVNVNGGATAIGHPLAATGLRCTITLARELNRSGERYGVAAACVGGGQGSALLIENPDAVT